MPYFQWLKLGRCQLTRTKDNMEQLIYQDHYYNMRRFPLRQGDRLRAWDAADEYLLRHIQETSELSRRPQILLVNDTFGALAVALHEHQPTHWGDSLLAQLALRHNLHLNHLPAEACTLLPSDASPIGSFDLVLIKLPKNLTFFADQLCHMRRCLKPGARVLLGGMIKHTPARAYRQLADIIGPTETTKGWKKARLASATWAAAPSSDAETTHAVYEVPAEKLIMHNLPNVFSHQRLDLGTRLLLAHLPATEDEITAVDLGCGNGVLALALAHHCPQAHIMGVDESFQAVASANLNLAQLGPQQHRLTFQVADGLQTEADASRDLVICNPPFHQGQTTGDLPAWEMFSQAQRVLRPGGELRVVGNRHLGYHAKLKRLFAQVEVIASVSKFVVLKATKNNSRF